MSKDLRLVVYYISDFDFCNDNSGMGIQIVNTCSALSLFCDVVLVSVNSSVSKQRIFDFYGVGGFNVLSVSGDIRVILGKLFAERFVNKFKEDERDVVVCSRDPSVIVNAGFLKKLGIKLFYECQSLVNIDVLNEGWGDFSLELDGSQRSKEQLQFHAFLVANSVIVSSKIMKEFLIKVGVSRGKVFVVHNAVRWDFSDCFVSRSTVVCRNIVFIGNKHSWSGLERLCEFVLGYNSKNSQKVRLHVFGDVGDINVVDENVIFYGRVSHSVLRDYLRFMDLAVFPYYGSFESIFCIDPMQLYEVAMAGIPFVHPDLPVFKELFGPGCFEFAADNDISFFRVLRESIGMGIGKWYMGYNLHIWALEHTYECRARSLLGRICWVFDREKKEIVVSG